MKDYLKLLEKHKEAAMNYRILDSEILKRYYLPNDLIPISNHNLFEEESYEVNKILDYRY